MVENQPAVKRACAFAGKAGWLMTFQDCFGPAYAAFDGDYEPGDFVEGALLVNRETDEQLGVLRCKVIRRVSPDEVLAAVRPFKKKGETIELSPAQWYEIHAD